MKFCIKNNIFIYIYIYICIITYKLVNRLQSIIKSFLLNQI